MATIYLVAARFWAEKCERTLGLGSGKYLKLLILFFLMGPTVGCASGQGTAFDRQLLLELEEQNTRLEAEVTRLREEKLRRDPKSDCSAGSQKTASSAPEEAPENLPLAPMISELPRDELEAGEAVIRPAEPPAEEEVADDETTRPVLTVRGKHEAWVYHRPVTAEDRKAKSDPASHPKKLPQESSDVAPLKN